jgi:hypothetical protein
VQSIGRVRKRYPNDKNYSVANPFGLQYASQAPVVQWIAPRTGIELIDPLQTDEQVSMIFEFKHEIKPLDRNKKSKNQI